MVFPRNFYNSYSEKERSKRTYTHLKRQIEVGRFISTPSLFLAVKPRRFERRYRK